MNTEPMNGTALTVDRVPLIQFLDGTLTRRDWFAEKAPHAPIDFLARFADDVSDRNRIRCGHATLSEVVSPQAHARALAEWAYIFADAMIAAREVPT